jgi:hypothetical protein
MIDMKAKVLSRGWTGGLVLLIATPSSLAVAAAGRQIAPLAGSTAHSRRPTFVVETGPSAVDVEVCVDRACIHPAITFAARGSAAVAPADLPLGNLFWRTRASVANESTPRISPTWHLRIAPSPSAPPNEVSPPDLDLNGDGYADIVLSISDPTEIRNHVITFFGGPNGLVPETATELQPPAEARDSFGRTVASVGDINGDGLGDMAVGAPGAGQRPSACRPAPAVAHDSTGRVYLYLGSPGGSSTRGSVSLAGQIPGERFGLSVSGNGDINRDGYADVVIVSAGGPPVELECAKASVPPPLIESRVSFYFGDAAGVRREPSRILVPDTWSGRDDAFWFGTAALVGDVNGDGYADTYVSAESRGRGAEIKAGIHWGSAAGAASIPSVIEGHLRPNGREIALGACTNGDGRSDVVVIPWQGRGPLVAFGMSGATPALKQRQTIPLTRLPPNRAAVNADLNGDGFTDLIVAATPAKRAYVYFGSQAGFTGKPVVVAPPPRMLRFATSASAGDFNGDGFGDVALGGFEQPGGERLFVYLGGRDGLRTRPSQVLAPLEKVQQKGR